MLTIALLTTNGTIDKCMPQGSGTRDLMVGDPVAPRILQRMTLHHSVMIRERTLMRKDSLDMTDEDRMAIGQACQDASVILITHGTDTMIRTAQEIDAWFHLFPRRTIVLTGALKPWCMNATDAEFNLGFALAACMYAPPGVYIAMNGIYRWDRCRKDGKTGVFLPS